VNRFFIRLRISTFYCVDGQIEWVCFIFIKFLVVSEISAAPVTCVLAPGCTAVYQVPTVYLFSLTLLCCCKGTAYGMMKK
jgi:hypothetical protein